MFTFKLLTQYKPESHTILGEEKAIQIGVAFSNQIEDPLIAIYEIENPSNYFHNLGENRIVQSNRILGVCCNESGTIIIEQEDKYTPIISLLAGKLYLQKSNYELPWINKPDPELLETILGKLKDEYVKYLETEIIPKLGKNES